MAEVGARFAANLKAKRKAEGISQKELAERASLHRTEVGLIERNKRKPRIDTLIKLAGALRTDANTLLEGIHWVPVARLNGRFAFDPPRGRLSRQKKEGKADG